MVHWWNDADEGKLKISARKPLQLYFFRRICVTDYRWIEYLLRRVWYMLHVFQMYCSYNPCFNTIFVISTLLVRNWVQYLCHILLFLFFLQVSRPTRNRFPIPGGESKIISILLFIFHRGWPYLGRYANDGLRVLLCIPLMLIMKSRTCVNGRGWYLSWCLWLCFM